MTSLAGCPSCSRHVRIDEPRCPFCAAGLEGAFANRPAPLAAVGRLSRAALFALGASALAAGTIVGCTDDSSDPEDDKGVAVPIYGAPAPPEDSGADAGNDTGTAAALYGMPAIPEDGGTSAALYGMPPGSQ